MSFSSNPDSASIDKLAELESDGFGKPAIFARNMLIAAKEASYQEPIILPDTSLKVASVDDPSLINIDQTNIRSVLVLKPNPAHQSFKIEYVLP